ncbi:MAG: hypothetical protein HY904_24620 [Deltaproteobacteria bacterium]|nr:hypothetical protein [Deltaproteobacteria bacterium]
MRCLSTGEAPARGYALFVALVLTATVLGASALVLERAAHHRTEARATQLRQAAASALASGHAAARVLAGPLCAGQAPPAGPVHLTLGEASVVEEFRIIAPGRVEVDVVAAAGDVRRRARHCFSAVPVPAAGGPLGEDMRGVLTRLAADACIIHARAGQGPVELQSCEGARAVRLRVEGDTALVDAGRSPPRLLVIEGEGSVTLPDGWKFTGVAWTRVPLHVAHRAQVTVSGALVWEAPGSPILTVDHDPATAAEALYGTFVDGCEGLAVAP